MLNVQKPKLIPSIGWLPIAICVVFIAILVTGLDSTSADIRLPKIFSDNMVVQRNAEIKVWGWALGGEQLEVVFGEFKSSTTADEQGRWQVIIPPMEASGPFELTVNGKDASVVVNGVYVGEVWICSGEANMEMSIGASLDCETEEEKQKLLAEFKNERIRFFTVGHSAVEKKLDDLTEAASWSKCNPDSSEKFSAVGYYFATHLLQQLDVFDELKDKNIAIGLINATWGGTPCEAWISEEGLAKDESLNPIHEYWKGNAIVDQTRPSALYNGMIAPWVNYKVRGTIWYQGESNVKRGYQYQTLLPALIEDWRTQFGEDMPFYFVQLAPFRYRNFDPKELAEVWDAQLKTYKTVEGTGMVVVNDIGKVDEIYSKKKNEVGRRLALWALAKTYGIEGLVYSGPIFEKATVDKDSILVKFSNVGDGLQATDGELKYFQICDDNKEFVAATASIEGKDTIRVKAVGITAPLAVRFAWDDSAQPNLTNSGGLPASPFRSDEFKLQSTGIHY